MKLLKETLWLIITLVLCVLIQYPIISVIDYKYFPENTMVIFISLYYLRLAADLKNVHFLQNKWIKYSLFSFNLFLFVFVITRIQKIIILYDVFSITAFAKKIVILSPTVENGLINYINTNFLFFGVFSLVAIVVFNMIILASFWRK